MARSEMQSGLSVAGRRAGGLSGRGRRGGRGSGSGGAPLRRGDWAVGRPRRVDADEEIA